MKTNSQNGTISETAQITSTSDRQTQPASDNKKIYWAELKSYPYQPDIQVEILHLQAEAEALLLHLQALGCK